MAERPSELAWTAEGVVARVRLRGSAVLASPMLNRGTAFTAAEREALGLTGLLPNGVALGELSGTEQVELDSAGDVPDGSLAGPAPGCPRVDT